MAYKVVITEDAERDFDGFLYYLVYEKRNPQAASHLIDSFEKTKIRLSEVADKLKICSNKKLASEGYRRINFVEVLSNYLAERMEIITFYGHDDALFRSLQNKRLGIRSIELLLKKYSLLQQIVM